jgi:hypothetical protein
MQWRGTSSECQSISSRKQRTEFTFSSRQWILENIISEVGVQISRGPWVACHKVAFPFHPLEAVQNLHSSLDHPFQALVVQAKQGAATVHTYSAQKRAGKSGMSLTWIPIKLQLFLHASVDFIIKAHCQWHFF